MAPLDRAPPLPLPSSPQVEAAPALPLVAPIAETLAPRDVLATASWYGNRERGRRTASGERFDPHKLTAASRSLPLGAVVRVVRLDTGAAVVVRVNDRMSKRYATKRLLDLSRGAAKVLDMTKRGLVRVRLERLC